MSHGFSEACCRGCTSGHLCFWSLLLLAQVLVLVLFLVSLLICAPDSSMEESRCR